MEREQSAMAPSIVRWPAALPHLRRLLRRHGDLRQARLRRGVTSATCCSCASRSLRRGAARGGAATRRAARAAAPLDPRRARHGRDRLRDADGPVLPRARADGRLAARARPLHVPGARVRGRRWRSGASAPPPGASAALLAALTGVALVLLGAASGSVDPLGAAMGLGAACAYTVYILVGDRVVGDVPPVAARRARVHRRGRRPSRSRRSCAAGRSSASSAAGWGSIGAIALVSHRRVRSSRSSPGCGASGRARRRSCRRWSRS